jgi:transposase
VRLYFRLQPDRNINTQRFVDFLRQLFRHVDGPLVLVWDRLNVHRSPRVRDYVGTRPLSQIVFLPAYAPELNPVEYLWSNWKMNPLVNLGVSTLEELVSAVRKPALATQRKRALLGSFIRHSPLSFCLE